MDVNQNASVKLTLYYTSSWVDYYHRFRILFDVNTKEFGEKFRRLKMLNYRKVKPNNTVIEFWIITRNKRFEKFCNKESYLFTDERSCYLSLPDNITLGTFMQIGGHIKRNEDKYIREIITHIEKKRILDKGYEIIGYRNSKMALMPLKWKEYTKEELDVMKDEIYALYIKNSVKTSEIAD